MRPTGWTLVGPVIKNSCCGGGGVDGGVYVGGVLNMAKICVLLVWL